jgi:hypothetical protein
VLPRRSIPLRRPFASSNLVSGFSPVRFSLRAVRRSAWCPALRAASSSEAFTLRAIRLAFALLMPRLPYFAAVVRPTVLRLAAMNHFPLASKTANDHAAAAARQH